MVQYWIPQILGKLPARFQQGKMPYAFFFALTVIGVLLTYAVVSPYPYASIIFSLFAVFLMVLLWRVHRGMALDLAVNLGTGLGACVLVYGVWVSGGIYSPRLAWLLVLPLTPFYVIGRKAGIFWTVVVVALRVAMLLVALAVVRATVLP